MDLRFLERLLPPSPPMASRWIRYRCANCGTTERLDLRVHRLPGVALLTRNGWTGITCRCCGGKHLDAEGMIVS